MRALALTLACSLWLGCTGSGADGPAEIKFDRDACVACGMIISDRHYAAQVRGPRGGPAKFDDLGCALLWLSRQSFAGDPATRIWVAHSRDGSWLDGRKARYQGGKTTPMGYGFAATGGPEGLDLDTVDRDVRALAQRRQEKSTP